MNAPFGRWHEFVSVDWSLSVDYRKMSPSDCYSFHQFWLVAINGCVSIIKYSLKRSSLLVVFVVGWARNSLNMNMGLFIYSEICSETDAGPIIWSVQYLISILVNSNDSENELQRDQTTFLFPFARRLGCLEVLSICHSWGCFKILSVYQLENIRKMFEEIH